MEEPQDQQPSKPRRHVCTPDDPWTPEKSERSIHPSAVDDGTCYEGCCDKWRCPVCGHAWREELPD